MSDVIEPSWSVFGPCSRCGAADGAPCKDLRAVRSATPPWARRKMRNPHKGRKQGSDDNVARETSALDDPLTRRVL